MIPGHQGVRETRTEGYDARPNGCADPERSTQGGRRREKGGLTDASMHPPRGHPLTPHPLGLGPVGPIVVRMTPSLSWLDHDAAARDRTRRILALFQEKGTQDQLGIGGIRDNLSDLRTASRPRHAAGSWRSSTLSSQHRRKASSAGQPAAT
jgi:hypothetical protein